MEAEEGIHDAPADIDHNLDQQEYLENQSRRNNVNPPGTKGFGTHTKHQGGGSKRTPPQYLKNEKCYKPETFGGVRSIL